RRRSIRLAGGWRILRHNQHRQRGARSHEAAEFAPAQTVDFFAVTHRSPQYRTRKPICSALGASCDVDLPKLLLFKSIVGSPRFTRLNALNASRRNSADTPVLTANLLERERLTSANPGPRNALRGRLAF